MSYRLYYPNSYLNASAGDIAKIVNGCGTKGWKGDLVPDKLLGVSITLSCNIHDWMYHEGVTVADKKDADNVFLSNMTAQIMNKRKQFRFMRRIRLRLARRYYQAVKYYVATAFWHVKRSKNK